MNANTAERNLVTQFRQAAPWNVALEIRTEAVSEPFDGPTNGLALMTFRKALEDAYQRQPTEVGQGGAIPVCAAFRAAYPDAEILLFGVEEPLSAIHSPNESVDPGELERIALAECLFLHRYRLSTRDSES
jgi:acetylornithine deacetylase/succinyl-diaminopimelate desuccinylase-like protein